MPSESVEVPLHIMNDLIYDYTNGIIPSHRDPRKMVEMLRGLIVKTKSPLTLPGDLVKELIRFLDTTRSTLGSSYDVAKSRKLEDKLAALPTTSEAVQGVESRIGVGWTDTNAKWAEVDGKLYANWYGTNHEWGLSRDTLEYAKKCYKSHTAYDAKSDPSLLAYVAKLPKGEDKSDTVSRKAFDYAMKKMKGYEEERDIVCTELAAMREKVKGMEVANKSLASRCNTLMAEKCLYRDETENQKHVIQMLRCEVATLAEYQSRAEGGGE